MENFQISFLQKTFEQFQTDTLNLYQQAHLYMSPIVVNTTESIQTLPYQVWLDKSFNFVDIYSIHLLIICFSFVMILINYLSNRKIIKNQKCIILKFTETESIDAFRLRSQVNMLLKEIAKKDKKIKIMENTVELYRSLRHSTVGFFLLRGDPSNREFRNKMKELGQDKRYVNNREYMVKLKHLNKFDKYSVTL